MSVTSAEVQRMNELNRQSFDRSKTSLFNHMNFRAINKLFAIKVLQNPLVTQNSVHKSKDSTVYTVNNLYLNDSGIPNANKFWCEETTRLLDFASGPASTSVNFLPYVKEAVGVDISQDMVNAYNEKALTLDATQKLRGYCLDIVSEDDSKKADLLGSAFDAAVCCLSYHHIPDNELITRKVVSHMKPGAWYFVMDFASSGSHEHEQPHNGSNYVFDHEEAARRGVAHTHGIEGDQLVVAFHNAGLINIGLEEELNLQLWCSESDGGPFLRNRKNELLNSKVGPDGETLYEVRLAFVLAYGQKPLQEVAFSS